MNPPDVLPASTDVSTMKHADLPAIWDGFRLKLEALKTTAETLTVTDAGQVVEMRKARETRLALRQIRLAVEHKRKELTDYHLKTKQEIDACARWLKEKLDPLEERLLYQEQFADRAEESRRLQLSHAREEALQPFGVDITTLAALDSMSEEQFQKVLDDAQAAYGIRLEAEARAVQARLDQEAHAAEERRQLQERNAQLEQEAATRRKEQEEERQRTAALAAAENAKLEAAKAELAKAQKAEADRKAAEQKAQVEKDAAELKARNAPDREKILALARDLRTLILFPRLTDANMPAIKALAQEFEAFTGKIERLANSL